MKKILLILPVLLISLCALAAIDPQSEKQAEEFYREGKYNEEGRWHGIGYLIL